MNVDHALLIKLLNIARKSVIRLPDGDAVLPLDMSGAFFADTNTGVCYMADMKWRKRVQEFLKKHREEPKRPSEIVKAMLKEDSEFKKYFEERGGKDPEREKKIIASLASRITSEYKNNPNLYPKEFKSIGSPREYYWTDKGDEDKIQEDKEDKDESNNELKLLEKDLYNPIREYLKHDLCVHSILISAQKSRQDGLGGRKWLYPDIVGVEDLSSNWEDEIRELSEKTDNKRARKKARLWSLEIKQDITSSNARKCFFQAVVNSSWANFGYLAGRIDKNAEEIIKELRRLADLYGIGIIALNKNDYAENRIIIPARERDEVDISTCNRLAATNEKFASYVQQVNKLYKGSFDSKFWQIPQDDS